MGLAIRSLRRERGLSQEALADLARIDRSYMSGVERGLRNVSILSMARISNALDVPLWELLRPRRQSTGIVGPAAAPHEWGGPQPEAVQPEPADWKPRYLSLG
jgi:transcriptional regulator with XRE-family HTH domain